MLNKRASGILLHISSLPSNYGIGDFGKSAYEFVDFLHGAHQSYWQILPLCPTTVGDSPYQSFSTFALNEYFIDLDALCLMGYLKKEEFEDIKWCKDKTKVDYSLLYTNRHRVLYKAFDRFKRNVPPTFNSFCEKQSYWLDDYALFCSVKDYFGGEPFYFWSDDIKYREPLALEEYSEICAERIFYYKTIQYFAFSQWQQLKAYANKNGVEIIGDVPIYVASDSADVWANKEIFKLDSNLKPSEVAGCPPDYFSQNGQLWGNPVYDWKKLKSLKYSWWKQRLKQSFELFDIVRLDHFRGFESFYSIKAGSKTAKKGLWKKGGGASFFDSLPSDYKDKIIAENLGFLSDDVDALLKHTTYAGMKVLQFSFDSRDDNDADLPDKIEKNNVVYTGTHDNDTILGWSNTADKADVGKAMRYLGAKSNDDLVNKMMLCAMKTKANTCILTMQDLLHLNSDSRMNTPSTITGNWQYRMKKDDITPQISSKLLFMTEQSERY